MTADDQLDALAALLRPVAEAIEEFESNPISGDTAAEYRKIYQRLERRVDYESAVLMTDVIARTVKKNTYYKRLAAVRYEILTEIIRCRDEAKKAITENDEELFDLMQHRLEVMIEEWSSFTATGGKCHLSVKIPRHSKRRILKELPCNWKEQLVQYLFDTGSKYSEAALVSAVSGARPAELKKGVKLLFLSQDGQDGQDGLLIAIKGAKVTKYTGQPRRGILFSIKQPDMLLGHIIDLVRTNGGEWCVQIENPHHFTVAISRAARRIWPHTSEDITAYCFRHSVSADAKKVLPPAQVAALLGHASVRTQKFYGQRQQARSGNEIAPILAMADREIRHADEHKKEPPSKRRNTGPENEIR